MKNQISSGGNGTNKTSGINIIISTMEVIPMMNNGSLFDLTSELQPAWANAANKTMKKIIEVFKILTCKYFNY